MMVELCQDLSAAYTLLIYHDKDSEAHLSLLAGYLPKLTPAFDSAMKILNGKDFYGGTSPSYGDFAFLALVDNMVNVIPEAMAAHPTMHAWYTRCITLPAVANFMVRSTMVIT